MSLFKRRQATEVLANSFDFRAAAVFATKTMFIVDSAMVYGLAVRDPDGLHKALTEPTDESLGETLRSALNNSRILTKEQADSFLFPAVRETNYEKWVQRVMDETGAQNRRALFRGLAYCAATEREGLITLTPMRRYRGEGFEGIGVENNVCVQLSAPDLELGAALRNCLSLVM